jgi:hypothetical protein
VRPPAVMVASSAIPMRRLAWAVVLAGLASVGLAATSVLIELRPQDAVGNRVRAGGFGFDTTSHPADHGAVTFRVVIEEAEQALPPSPLNVSVGRYVVSATSTEASPKRVLQAARTDHTAICTFTVDRATLDDPQMVFLFFVPSPVHMPSQTNIVARLGAWAARSGSRRQ